MMGPRGGGFLGRSTVRRCERACACTLGVRERTCPDPVRSHRRKASAGTRGQGAVPCRPSDRDGRPRQRSHPGPRIADARHSCRGCLAGAAARAFSRAANREFPERGARPLDRRYGGDRQLRSRSRHPRLRVRRGDQGSPCRHCRLDRLAWKRADHGEPDFHSADAGHVNRRCKRGGGDGSGGFDRDDRDRRVRRQEALIKSQQVYCG